MKCLILLMGRFFIGDFIVFLTGGWILVDFSALSDWNGGLISAFSGFAIAWLIGLGVKVSTSRKMRVILFIMCSFA